MPKLKSWSERIQIVENAWLIIDRQRKRIADLEFQAEITRDYLDALRQQVADWRGDR